MSKAEKLLELARRRGIFWSSYEIYGGASGFYDLGPIGVLIKRNIVELWRNYFIYDNDDLVVEIETPIISPKRVFEASGHVENFIDPIVKCNKCNKIYRADHLVEELTKIRTEGLSPEKLNEIIKEKKIKCPNCGGELGEVKVFNLLFETRIGPYADSIGYLRPEAAQGMFTSFKRVFEAFREKLPIGIAQVGRVARNEISPRQGIIRMREFTIMEIEFFYNPEETSLDILNERGVSYDKINILLASDKIKGNEKPVRMEVYEAVREKIILSPWQAFWMAIASRFITKLGINEGKSYFEEKLPEERAHYSLQTFDQIVETEGFGKIEISGHANRGRYDLSRHQQFSNQDMTVFIKYSEPIIVKEKRIIFDRRRLYEIFKEKAEQIIEEVNKIKVEEIEDSLRTKDYITIKGYEIPKSIIKVIEEERKVSGKKIIPSVVEPSFGAERLLYVVLENAINEREGRLILSLPPSISPYQVAVFPLLEREKLINYAINIYKLLKNYFKVFFDYTGSIGKRYARADEIGIPFSVTIDPRTLNDRTLTIRDRDTWNQIRVKEEELITKLQRALKGERLELLGEIVRE